MVRLKVLEVGNIGLLWLTSLGLAGKCGETIEADAKDSGPLHWLKWNSSNGWFTFFPTEVVEFSQDVSCIQGTACLVSLG